MTTTGIRRAKRWSVSAALCMAGAGMFASASSPVAADDLIVSANDAKFVRDGPGSPYPEGVGPDTLTVIDASRFPPTVVDTIEVDNSLGGPPQCVAITPDGRLAIVSAPNHYDRAKGEAVLGNYLQVVDLAASPARVIERIDIGAHPQGLAINRDGTLLLAATLDGSVAVLGIDGAEVTLKRTVKVADERLSGVSFTHDGTAALVARRDEQGLVVLDIADGDVIAAGDRVTTGVAPYAVDVSSDGNWAVVGNAGLASLGESGRLIADVDTVTLVDVSQRPFRAVQHITVPSLPEAVAISPDGRWIAVQSMAGSSLPADNPGYAARGRLVLFEIRDGRAVETANVPGGRASQGIVFSADGRMLLVQYFVEKQIAVFRVNDGNLEDTGERIPIAGGPASIRSMPR